MENPAAIRSFFVTLKRSFAGTKEAQIRILKSLGLKHRHQCVQRENTSSVRGALNKVCVCVSKVSYSGALHKTCALECNSHLCW